MSTGTRRAQARKKQHLTQEQLAEQLGVTRQSVSRWESDAAYPETDKLVRLAQLFGVSCDYLLQGVGEASGGTPPSPVTRLLRQAAGRRVQLTFYEDGLNVACDWCTILEFEPMWSLPGNAEIGGRHSWSPWPPSAQLPSSKMRGREGRHNGRIGGIWPFQLRVLPGPV